MAKKKTTTATHVDKPPKEDPVVHHTLQPAAMDKKNGAASEQLDNLKSLNTVLLNETVQRRQQVNSLLRSKASLESDLTRAQMDNTALQAELVDLHDGVAMMDLENGVVSLVVGTQVTQQAEAIGKERVETDERIHNGAMELEKALREKAVCIESLEKEKNRLSDEIDNERVKLKHVYAERDAIIAELDVQIQETNSLKSKLADAEKFGKEASEDFEKLKLKINSYAEEREDRERTMESILKQKTDVDRALQVTNREMEQLKIESEEIMRLKEKTEDDKNEELKKNNKLQKIVDELNVDLLNLKLKETMLHDEIEGLERWRIEAAEKEKEMSSSIEVLVKEKMQKEKRIEILLEENGNIKKNLDDSIKEIDAKTRDLEELVNSKVRIDNEKAEKEKEVIELQKELSKIRIDMSAMEELLKSEVDKNEQFQLEVKQGKEVIDEITNERDEAIKGLNYEKQQSNNLMSRIETMEKEIEETQKLMEKIVAEKNNLLGERDDARKGLNEEKDRGNSLMSRIASMEKQIEETQKLMEKMVDEKKNLLGERDDARKGLNEEKDRGNNLMSRMATMEKEIEEAQKLMEKMIAEKNNLLGERDDARKGLTDEKKQGKVLMSKISTMEKEIEEIQKLMAKMSDEKNNLCEERGKLESHCETLKKEIASLQISLKKANEHTESLKAEIESATADSKKVVGLVKNTRALVCNPKDVRNGRDEDAEFEVELETIKNAFKNKEEKVEVMKRELELLQNSMKVANKKKSFWAFVSSATTICCAAISLAYVAKGH